MCDALVQAYCTSTGKAQFPHHHHSCHQQQQPSHHHHRHHKHHSHQHHHHSWHHHHQIQISLFCIFVILKKAFLCWFGRGCISFVVVFLLFCFLTYTSGKNNCSSLSCKSYGQKYMCIFKRSYFLTFNFDFCCLYFQICATSTGIDPFHYSWLILKHI